MSSAITLVGNQQVIAITSRLIVGIRLQGTIGFIDPRRPFYVKPRPYLSYLAETLRRLECDVTVFVPTNGEHDAAMMTAFHDRDFAVPFRYVHDQSKFVGMGGGRGNRKGDLAPNNYTEYLRIHANRVNGTGPATDRILFIDSEVNYRFTPVQTIVLDSFVPLTRRQQRELVKEQYLNPFGDVSSQQARRHAATAARAARRTVRHRAALHEQGIQEALDKEAASTALLEAEQAGVSMVDAEATLEDFAAGTAASPSPQQRGHGESGRGGVAGTASTAAAEAAAAAAAAKARKAERAKRLSGDGSDDESPAGALHALAINLEDYSLVALAEMIAEMAASDVSVAEYIKLEPLIEKVEVPFHGKANYLPPENCDNIELLNWDEIKVMEKKSQGSGRDEEMVKETEEHKDFFQ